MMLLVILELIIRLSMPGQSDCSSRQDGLLLQPLGVHHGRVLIMLDIKYDQNSCSGFQDMGLHGQTD